MKLFKRNELSKISFPHSKCLYCNENRNEDDWEKFNAKEDLAFVRCKSCHGSFKLRKRKMKHPEDRFLFEQISDDTREGEDNGRL